MLRVLVADDDQGLRLIVRSTLEATGRFEVDEAVDGLSAVEKTRSSHYDLVILDVDMPHLDGLEALRQIKQHDPSITVLIVTAYANIDDAVRSVKEGAYDYISKPVEAPTLVDMVNRAVSAKSMIAQLAASSPVLMEAGRRIIGNSAEMQKVFNIINRLSKVDTPVLIRGASGTGKELVARAIHFNSARKGGKFVAINCSAIPENLFESELFGHEKGSFTGADQRKIGKFQFAEGGTLFLDEVGDLPLLLQAKLLRVLQEKVFTPVGANREIQSDVRIIAATNRPLEKMIEENSFREDLFYRLNVIPIFLPSLAERKNDIDQMVANFIKKFNTSQSKKIIGITPDALALLKRYEWPGNIRELENVIEHAFILETSNKLTLASMPEKLLAATGVSVSHHILKGKTLIEPDDGDIDASDEVASMDLSDSDDEEISMGEGDTEVEGALGANVSYLPGGKLDYYRQKEAFEKEFIIKALKTFKGRINQTAIHANISKKTLLRKMEKFGIIAKEYSKG